MKTLNLLKPLTLACALALASTPALAQAEDAEVSQPAADEMPAALANGLTVAQSDGTSTEVTFTEDGSYTASDGSNGAWTLARGFLCMTMEDGATGCTSMPDDVAAGDSWSKTSNDGTVTTYSLPEADTETETEIPGGEGGGAVY